MNQRLRALCDLSMSTVREYVGRHEYDGRVEDLSPEGVRAALARVGGPSGHAAGGRPARRGPAGRLRAAGPPGAGRAGAVPGQPAVPRGRPGRVLLRPRVRPGHRAGRGPPAPPGRLAGRGRRRRGRPRPGPRPGRRGPPARRQGPDRRPGPPGGDPVVERAVEAHKRLVAHLEAAAADGHPETALGRGAAGAAARHRRGPGGRPGPAGGAGRRRAGPAAGHPGRGLRAAAAGPAHRRGGGLAARRPPRRRRRAPRRRGPDRRVDRLHPGAGPGARAGRRVPGRAVAPVAPVGPGHDVLGGPVRGRRPLPLLHLPARAGLAGRASRTTG